LLSSKEEIVQSTRYNDVNKVVMGIHCDENE